MVLKHSTLSALLNLHSNSFIHFQKAVTTLKGPSSAQSRDEGSHVIDTDADSLKELTQSVSTERKKDWTGQPGSTKIERHIQHLTYVVSFFPQGSLVESCLCPSSLTNEQRETRKSSMTAQAQNSGQRRRQSPSRVCGALSLSHNLSRHTT